MAAGCQRKSSELNIPCTEKERERGERERERGGGLGREKDGRDGQREGKGEGCTKYLVHCTQVV